MSEAISWPIESTQLGAAQPELDLAGEVIQFPTPEEHELREIITELILYANVITCRAKGIDYETHITTEQPLPIERQPHVPAPGRLDGLVISFKDSESRMHFGEILDEFEFSCSESSAPLALFRMDETGCYQLMTYECDPGFNPEFDSHPDMFLSADRHARNQFLEFLRAKNYEDWCPEQ